MAYIPADAEWYLADVVIEIQVEGHPESIVHTNTMLIRAGSPEEAYEKALKLGEASEMEHQNIVGSKVTFRFRGLRDLNVIHDKLEDGSELVYHEQSVTDKHAITRWVTPKGQLAVFAPIEPSQGPD
jgi:Domain of unknown function (DUF4288)